MSNIDQLSRPGLTSAVSRECLPYRDTPYWSILAYCRHIGYLKRKGNPSYWMARLRTKDGLYKERRVALAEPGGIDYDAAVCAAQAWFNLPWNTERAAESYPVGTNQNLHLCPIGDVYTVGHALHDYVEWKRIAAAASHFETNLSLINYYFVPRLSHIALKDFTGLHLRSFARFVLETPPKRGRQPANARRPIAQMGVEELRKRKKTLNTLIGILRIAFQMAWENGRFENDRAWRCLRRVPNVDRPRLLHLSRRECRDLLRNCRPDLRDLVLGALYTGCRSKELLTLTVADVARDGYGIYVAPSKNYQPRFVFLPDEGMAFFLGLCRGKGQRDPLFQRLDAQSWRDRQYRYIFNAAVRAADLPSEFTFHGLRHTYASQLVQAGTPLIVVASQLGHADTNTVSRTYGHLAPQIAESEIRQRFSCLDFENAKLADKEITALEALRQSLHGPGWRTYAEIVTRSAWPRSNFYRGNADMVELCREGELDNR